MRHQRAIDDIFRGGNWIWWESKRGIDYKKINFNLLPFSLFNFDVHCTTNSISLQFVSIINTNNSRDIYTHEFSKIRSRSFIPTCCRVSGFRRRRRKIGSGNFKGKNMRAFIEQSRSAEDRRAHIDFDNDRSSPPSPLFFTPLHAYPSVSWLNLDEHGRYDEWRNLCSARRSSRWEDLRENYGGGCW